MSETLTIAQFKQQYLGQITVGHLLGNVDDHKLNECLRIEKNQMVNIEDINRLGRYKLVWYKDANGNKKDWSDSGAFSMALASDQKLIQQRQGVPELIASLKKGLSKNIEIVVVHDETINETVIIDGVHRATALYSLLTESTEMIDTILNSTFSLYEVKLVSKVAGLLFPFDFLNLYQHSR